MKTKILKTTSDDINIAGEILKNGGLVAFPTETVYGLGANAFNEDAVKNIYKAKGRPSDNPLIVHISNKNEIVPLVEQVTPKAKALIDVFFPGALTIILKKSELINDTVSGGLDTVAIRMPKNKTAHEIIKASGVPIAAPSANTSGKPSPTKSKHVIDDLSDKIDAIVDGEDCEIGIESTVITLVSDTPTILRPGKVTKEEIEAVIGDVEISHAVLNELKSDEVAASPGMKYKHYSPKAKVIIVDANKSDFEKFVNKKTDSHALCFEGDDVKIPHITFGREKDDLSQGAALFDSLRQLDELGATKVYARIPNKNGVGIAVFNRLIRAAAFDVIDLKKPFTLGITGPTGAGKGYVCNLLKNRGFKIIDSDKVAHEVTKKGAQSLDLLTKAFGDDIVKNGELDRQLLANRAFNNKENTAKLNEILHPIIANECKNQSEILCALDAPQLFEAGLEKECYKTISVIAPTDVRLKRIIERDKISQHQAQQRINAQFSEEYYKSHSDFVINSNNNDVEKELDDILNKIL